MFQMLTNPKVPERSGNTNCTIIDSKSHQIKVLGSHHRAELDTKPIEIKLLPFPTKRTRTETQRSETERSGEFH